MTSVETVRGAAGTDTLGRVLMHEHVFILTSDINYNFPEISGWAEDERVDEAVARLTSLRDAGMGTIVDLTVLNMGRFIPACRRSTKRSTSTSSPRRGSTRSTSFRRFSPRSGPVPGSVATSR